MGKAVTKFLPDRVPVTFVGRGATGELCEAIAATGTERLGIVTDEGLIAAGIVDRVEAALDRVGVSWSVFSGVQPDPTLTQVEEGLAQLMAKGCDAILAVGGGSPIDTAKVIAAAATNPGPIQKLEGTLKVKQPTLPLYALPTTAGTGSEATLAAVVSDPQTHQKKFILDPKILPSMAALDPTLMIGLPPHITAATGMDALTHAVESVLARTTTAQTEAWARMAIRAIFSSLPRAFAQGDDMVARKSMALASFYAGLAFTRTSVGYVHAIAHSLGAFYGTPHGLGNAIALVPVLEFSLEAAAPRMAMMARWSGIAREGMSEREQAEAFIAGVGELSGSIGIPSTLDRLQADDLPAIAKQVVAEAHMNYPVPRYMVQGDCECLLKGLLP
ncbi:MAG: iron-containing alcohol dehydrogenase [bacterium]|nr:iron-containing alcohol dehydrogenase [bacterium]